MSTSEKEKIFAKLLPISLSKQALPPPIHTTTITKHGTGIDPFILCEFFTSHPSATCCHPQFFRRSSRLIDFYFTTRPYIFRLSCCRRPINAPTKQTTTISTAYKSSSSQAVVGGRWRWRARRLRQSDCHKLLLSHLGDWTTAAAAPLLLLTDVRPPALCYARSVTESVNVCSSSSGDNIGRSKSHFEAYACLKYPIVKGQRSNVAFFLPLRLPSSSTLLIKWKFAKFLPHGLAYQQDGLLIIRTGARILMTVSCFVLCVHAWVRDGGGLPSGG